MTILDCVTKLSPVFISPYGLCPRLKNKELRPGDRKWGQIVEIEEDKKSEKGIVNDCILRLFTQPRFLISSGTTAL